RRQDMPEPRARPFAAPPEILQRLLRLDSNVTLDHFSVRPERPLPREEDEVVEGHAPREGEPGRGKARLDGCLVHGPRIGPFANMRLPGSDFESEGLRRGRWPARSADSA